MFLYVFSVVICTLEGWIVAEERSAGVSRARGRGEGLRIRWFSGGERVFLLVFSSLLVYEVETSFISHGSIVIKHHVLFSQVGQLCAVSAAARSRVAVQHHRCSSQFVSVRWFLRLWLLRELAGGRLHVLRGLWEAEEEWRFRSCEYFRMLR